ncbi:Hypothetical protein I595_1110 [Croceitalea dokdonensis DOKDO 023]|uniref:Bacteriophage T5 Orf172 DNA-binding domain-containing protein n=1 Tax=Croceitalea dokdonensis DOKDO 023 TaxID=1300341 RepID=A0A0N8H487_9FLAO|nr:DUF4041 domain-containing protein [Croceitalea dokdonensis]KPM32684.1 Hypothetical protein I595_1110 [Croceitalea dokdonensis DOKDO 023]
MHPLEYILSLGILGLLLVLTIFALFKNKKKLKSEIKLKDVQIIGLNSDLNRYNGIISVEKEIHKIKESQENEEKQLIEIQTKASDLNIKYKEAKSIYKALERDIKLYQNDLEFVELGIYQPIFDYDTSDKYKEELAKIRAKQKELIKEGDACVCYTQWHVNGNYKKGEVMTRRYINLTLRAFNGECDTLISKVKWNNVQRFTERINKSYRAINRLGKSNNVEITEEYLQLKLDELHLAYEMEHKKQVEKEEQRAIRLEQREEERAQREFEKAKKEAEIEEKRYQKALERAQKELGLVSGEELEKLNNQIAELQKNLQEAHAAKERAISRAQETKSGHVYIISNIGSFGENIYKIGMTRRLEPMDRVKELGDASVPFRFDLHALIFTENAPELENLLQKEFDDRRINKVNYRKEYFRVTLDDIQRVIKEKYEKEVEFIKFPEAQEYRETKSIIKQLEQVKQEQIENEIEKYPDSLF